MLYTTAGNGNELIAWRIDAKSGMLARSQDLLLEETTPTQIMIAPQGESIFILDGPGGSIYKVTANPATGELHSKSKVALVSEPKSMALKTI
jgi:6-phosphogluconolactonase (cycloisomerase 2 family)